MEETEKITEKEQEHGKETKNSSILENPPNSVNAWKRTMLSVRESKVEDNKNTK